MLNRRGYHFRQNSEESFSEEMIFELIIEKVWSYENWGKNIQGSVSVGWEQGYWEQMNGVELYRTSHAMVRSLDFILSTVGNCRFNCCVAQRHQIQVVQQNRSFFLMQQLSPELVDEPILQGCPRILVPAVLVFNHLIRCFPFLCGLSQLIIYTSMSLTLDPKEGMKDQ